MNQTEESEAEALLDRLEELGSRWLSTAEEMSQLPDEHFERVLNAFRLFRKGWLKERGWWQEEKGGQNANA